MMAIPFHSSVRIKLGAGSQILNKDKEPIGINVSAKTIKNKVSAPFRSCDFEIHFGKGIREHEQIFDLLRKHGSDQIDGYTIEIGGSGAWKHLEVYNADGEQIIEKKFYKAEFDKIMNDPEYSQYIDMLLETAMIRKNETDDPDIDPESYSDIQAVSDHVMEKHYDVFEMLK
jgi:recombination protein RecA